MVKLLRSRTTIGVSNVARSIDFYRSALGLEPTVTMGDPPTFAILSRDDVGLGVYEVDAVIAADFACCYVNVKGVEEAYERCLDAGVPVTHPLTRHPWGNHDFVIEDPDGHRIAVGEDPLPH